MKEETFKKIKKLATDHGGKLLSGPKCQLEKDKLKWECEKGHICIGRYNSFRHWTCNKCFKESQLRLAIKVAINNNGKCLSNEYVRSNKKMQWECAYGHVWEATFGRVVKDGTWCPKCNLKSKVDRALLRAKKIAKDRGGECLSKEATSVKKEKLLWRCKCGNIWYDFFVKIRSGKWCPVCRNKKILEYIKNIAKNRGGECLSEKYTGYNCILKLKCSEGHIWETMCTNFKNSKSWCPICANTSSIKISDVREFARKLDVLCLSEVYTNEHTKLKWQCKNGHTWQSTYANAKRSECWCQQCAKDKFLNKAKQIAIEHGGKCLSSAYKNNDKKLMWQCKYEHKWEASYNTVCNKKSWCPVCAGNVPPTIEFVKNIAKSRGGECLSDRYINGYVSMKWKCGSGHVWETSYSSIVNKNSWCPVCSKTLPHTLNEAKQVAKDRDGKCLSSEYKNNKVKMKWQCKRGHVWEATFGHILNNESWCPSCSVKKSQRKLHQLFEDLLGEQAISLSPNWLKNPKTKRNLEIDIYFPSLKLAIEYQGRQHYEEIEFWGGELGLKRRRNRDQIKKQLIEQSDQVNKFIIWPYTTEITEENVLLYIINTI